MVTAFASIYQIIYLLELDCFMPMDTMMIKEKSFVVEYAKKIGLTEEDVNVQSGLIDKYLILLKEMYDAIQ